MNVLKHISWSTCAYVSVATWLEMNLLGHRDAHIQLIRKAKQLSKVVLTMYESGHFPLIRVNS
jgi:hypothetical protein